MSLALRTLLDLGAAETTDDPPNEIGVAIIAALVTDLQHSAKDMREWASAVKIEQALQPMLQQSGGVVTLAEQVYLKHLGLRAPWVQITALHVAPMRYLCGLSAAKAVMWAHATAALAARTNTTRPGVRELFTDNGNEFMRHRLPTEAGYGAVWAGQKVPSVKLERLRAENPSAPDNYLDHPMAWSKEALCAGLQPA
jgi:hypothetical protein